MIRRISTKWFLAVLGAVVVPFAVFAFFVNTKVTERLGKDVVRFHLLSMAGDLSDRIDADLDERRQDVKLVASIPVLNWFVDGLDDDRGTFQVSVEAILDQLVQGSGVYDYVLALDRQGRVVGMNTASPAGQSLSQLAEEYFFQADFQNAAWFQEAIEHGSAAVDFHGLGFASRHGEDGLNVPEGESGEHYISFAHRIEPLANQDGPVGVLVALMNWRHVQEAVGRFGVRRLEEGDVESGIEDIYASSYAWIWKADADTIIAHPNRGLYGQRVSELEQGQLAPMVSAARVAAWGMYPDYEFRGIHKKAAFKRCRGEEQGGFGWVVGVGVDDADIYAPVRELSHWLITLSVSILLLTILVTAYLAHRTTRPIRELEQHFDRVGHGDLDAQIDVRTDDELGQLAKSFNRMTAELKQNRAQLLEAEKQAAWRGLARQVAHEIKNPLTPISLTLGLLKRSRDEGSPEFDSILTRTIEVIQRQVETMGEVVRDFTALAGVPTQSRPVDVAQTLAEALDLYQAVARDQGVTVPDTVREGNGAPVILANPPELQRCFVNLVANALEAMPDGGELSSCIQVDEDEVVISLCDTGAGVSDEAAAHLFEPHFTTRSAGTGLGLAIVHRVVEDARGTITLRNKDEGTGAIARMVFPRPEDPAVRDAILDVGEDGDDFKTSHRTAGG